MKKTINLWESKIANRVVYLHTIEEVIQAIKDGKITYHFLVMDEYNDSIYPPQTDLEQAVAQNSIHINYTNSEHPVLYSSASSILTPPIISTAFYNKYKKEISQAFFDYVLNNDFIIVNNLIFSDELLEKILEREEITVHFRDVILTEEQISKLQERHIEADVDGETVSSMYVIARYTRKQLTQLHTLHISIKDLDTTSIDNFRYLPDNCKIYFLDSDKIPEIQKYQLITNFLIKLNKLNKPFKITIDINKRSLLEKSDLLKQKFQNLEITFVIDTAFLYTFQEYIDEENKLNSLVKDIKNSDLSPFEKFIAAYNIAKKYKQYRESENLNEARYLKYILDNEYIVCVGFSNLLIALLDKVGINAVKLSINVDTSYENGFSQETISVNHIGHNRVLLSLDDDKYNIHGIYVADPTWDNDLQNDLLNYALMTIDKMQTSDILFWNNNITLIFDVHSFQEFNEHINYLFRKVLSEKRDSYKKCNISKSENQLILLAYDEIIVIIKKVLEQIDFENWNKIYSKYSFKTEQDYTDFLTEIGHFIVSRTNKSINNKKIIRAFLVGKQQLLGLKKRQINDVRTKLTKDFYDRQKKVFPYYLTDDTYLGEKKKTGK